MPPGPAGPRTPEYRHTGHVDHDYPRLSGILVKPREYPEKRNAKAFDFQPLWVQNRATGGSDRLPFGTACPHAAMRAPPADGPPDTSIRRPNCPRGLTPMAQRVVVTLSDDLDGGTAAETVHFGVDGKSYEIDLSVENAEKLREALAPFVAAGRRQSRTGKSFRRTALTPDPQAVRAWAQSHGMDLPARGRIPKAVYEQFAEAN
jgi:hypothetical protein